MALTYDVPSSVLSTTLQNMRDTIEDNIFKAMPLPYWLMGKYPNQPNDQSDSRGQKNVIEGGSSIVIPLMYGTNSTAGSYSGYDILDTTPQDGITSAQYNWKQNSASISISGIEEAMNRGEQAKIKLLQAKITQAEMSLTNEMGRQWAVSTGTDTSKDCLGLGTIVSTTSTIGGLSGTTYSWWQSTVNASIGSFAANGLTKMRSLYNTISKGNEHPDLILSDQATFEYYEGVVQPQERFTDAKTADAGFVNLKFKGATYMYDNNTYFTAGTQYMLNSKYLNWTVMKGMDFATTDFIRPENQDARTAQILVYGELTCSNRARQGANTGFTA